MGGVTCEMDRAYDNPDEISPTDHPHNKHSIPRSSSTSGLVRPRIPCSGGTMQGLDGPLPDDWCGRAP